MSDIRYSVIIDYASNVSGLDAPAKKLDHLNNKFKGTTAEVLKHVGAAANSFNSLFDSAVHSAANFSLKAGAAVAAGVTGALGLATKEAFRFNEQMENAKLGLATIFNMNGIGKEFGSSFRVAGDVVKQMVADSNRLPGTYEDLQKIMMTIAAPGAQMGLGAHQMARMSANAMSFAASANVPMAVAGRELAKALDGSIRHGMPFTDRLGLGDPKEFNKLMRTDSKKGLALLNSRLEAAAVGGGYAENNFETMKTTLKSKISQSLGAAGMPLFEGLKEVIGGKRKFGYDAGLTGQAAWNDTRGKLMGGITGEGGLIEKYTPHLVVLGQRLNDALSKGFENAFENGKKFFLHWFPLVHGFADRLGGQLHAAVKKLEPFLEKFGRMAEKFLSQSDPMGGIKGALAGAAALRVGTGVLGSMPGAMSGLSMAGGSGGLAGGAAAAAPAVGILAALAVAVGGVVSVLTDNASLLQGFATGLLGDIINSSKEYVTHVLAIAHNIRPIANLLGTVLLGGVAVLFRVLNGVVSVVEYLTGALKYLIEATIYISNAFDHFRDGALASLSSKISEVSGALSEAANKWAEYLGLGDQFSQFKSKLSDLASAIGETAAKIWKHIGVGAKLNPDDPDPIPRDGDYLPVSLMNATALAENAKAPKAPTNVTHIHNVEIKVTPNTDPSRFAKRMVDVIKDAALRGATNDANVRAANPWIRY